MVVSMVTARMLAVRAESRPHEVDHEVRSHPVQRKPACFFCAYNLKKDTTPFRRRRTTANVPHGLPHTGCVDTPIQTASSPVATELVALLSC